MKISNIKRLFFSSLVIIVISIFSCNKENNPVINTNDPIIVDSNFFNWEFDTIHVMPSLGMYIADTNKIFIPANHYSVYINNGSIRYISHNDYDFAGWCISGIDINNVYIGGSSISFNRSKLKLWNGTEIKDIAMPTDSSNNIFSIEAVSSNDIWMATNKPIVYRYLNQTFTTYRFDNFDSKLTTGIIYKDKSGILFAHFLKHTSGVYDYLYMFKFENDIWIQASKDSISENSIMQNFIGFSDNKMLYSGRAGLYYFTGSTWEKYVNLGNSLSGILRGCGRNAESILFQADENHQSYIFYYDGKKIYRNSNLIFPYPALMSMQYKYGRFYITTGEDYTGNSFFYLAKFK